MNQIEEQLTDILKRGINANAIVKENKSEIEYSPKGAKAFYSEIQGIRDICDEILKTKDSVDIVIDKE